jgi:dimethylhistidine N-methyltransferase
MTSAESDFVDAAPEHAELRSEVLRGLAEAPKSLPCKLFYDSVGASLFEDICEVDEYYLTRTELSILQEHAQEMADLLGPHCSLIEFGSGSGLKTRLLLDHLRMPSAYVPIDISRAQLLASSKELRKRYPALRVLPVCADYTRDFILPSSLGSKQRAVFFPGSTIGNFDPRDAVEFLRRIQRASGHHGQLLIGVDLKKDPRILEAAYNDRAGVTAAFNRNILRVVNNVAGANFEPDAFRHEARWNAAQSRIEMHLISTDAQRVQIGRKLVAFAKDESIVTEHCYKYELKQFESLVQRAGFNVRKLWMDPQHFFSVQLLTAT